MRKRVHIALAVLLVMLAGVIGWQGLRLREPVYQGKSLGVWLAEYAENTAASKRAAEEAVRHIGTNAIPALLEMLSRKDSKLVYLWERHISEFRFIPNWVRYQRWHRLQPGAETVNSYARLGFQILRADAKQAVPALIKLCERNISPSSHRAASLSLTAIGPAARIAIPSFVRETASSSDDVRFDAANALLSFPSEPRLIVPAFVKGLSDTSFSVRMVAVMGLANFGTNAQEAVPPLVRMLSDPNGNVRTIATDALRAIDPEAAAKAGVQ